MVRAFPRPDPSDLIDLIKLNDRTPVVQFDEVDKILWNGTFKGRCEMLVRWAGYDESHNQWVRRSVLEEDVSTLVLSYDVDPNVFVSRKSVPKRVTKGPADLLQPVARRSRRST